MKSQKLTLDLTDHPQLLKMLKLHAARVGITQKAVVVEALQTYFAANQESLFLMSAANKTFEEWDNPLDKVYDSI